MAWMVVLLVSIAFLTAGVAGFLIFGPLTYRHLQDRGRAEAVGRSAFDPRFLRWLLAGGYRDGGDRGLLGLATPARVLLIHALAGAAGSVIAGLLRP